MDLMRERVTIYPEQLRVHYEDVRQLLAKHTLGTRSGKRVRHGDIGRSDGERGLDAAHEIRVVMHDEHFLRHGANLLVEACRLASHNRIPTKRLHALLSIGLQRDALNPRGD
jgi:hypothetical protein